MKRQLQPSTLLLSLLTGIMFAAASRTIAAERSWIKSAKPANEPLRPFTVSDSIAMTHFAEPNEGSADHPQVSPDGKHFLVVLEKGMLDRNVRRFTLLVYDGENAFRTPITLATFDSSSNNSGIYQARWLDYRQVSFIGEHPGQQPQVYVVDITIGRIRKLTNSALGVVCYAVSRDRRKVLYYSPWIGNPEESRTREEHGFAVGDENLADLVTNHGLKPHNVYKLFLQRAGKRHPVSVGEEPFTIYPSVLNIWLSPDAHYAVTEQPASRVPKLWEFYDDPLLKQRVREEVGRTHDITPWEVDQVMLVDTESGKARPLIDAPVSSYALTTAVWSSDSRSVVVAGSMMPLNSDQAEDLVARKARPVISVTDIVRVSTKRIRDIEEGESIQIRPGSRPDSFVATGFTFKGDDNTGRLQDRLYLRQGQEWVEDHSYEALSFPGSELTIKESLSDWPKLVKVDPTNHQEAVILDPNPQFSKFRFGQREEIHWTGKRGEPLMGGLVFPTDYSPGRRYPLVIQTHGFDRNMFLLDGAFTTAFAAEELANKGVFVLQEGTGSLYRESELTDQFGPVLVSGVESAIDYLSGKGLIDRNNVALVGFSMSGFEVLYALAHSSYHFATATSAEGNDWGYWSYVAGGNSGGWAAQAESPYGGPPWNGNWQAWIRYSITFSFDRIHVPLRIESDSNDYGAVIYEWEKFIALKRLRKPVELIYLCHGAHPVVKPWDRMTSQQGNVDWLMFWLKGEEDPDPTKAEQYARWRELRKLQEAQKD